MKKQDAIDHFGGAAKLALALGCKPQAISQWRDHVPQGRAYQIEVLTGGKLKAGAHSTPQQPTPCV
ncbi:TPA: Cro/CI family transcriptional regulator [Aeromonas veronii]